MSAPPDTLRVELLDDGSGRCIAVHGELTHATAADLDRRLQDAAVAPPDLVLDVSDLVFCDSAGLAALLGGARRVRRAGGRVALRGVHGSLQRLLRMTGAVELFRTDPAADGEDGGAVVPEGRRA